MDDLLQKTRDADFGSALCMQRARPLALPDIKPSTVILGAGRKPKQFVECRINTMRFENERARPSESTANMPRVETGKWKECYSEETALLRWNNWGFVCLQGPLRLSSVAGWPSFHPYLLI